jgi:two-component system, sensor histidine kinase and response regulator
VISGKSYQILIVDDQQDNVFLLEMLMRRQPEFVVNSVENGLQAVAYCLENTVDLVLMDVMMPVMDGNTATRKLREHFDESALPVIMITTLSDVDNLVKSFDAGANDYVTKPIEWNALRSRIISGLRVKDAVQEQKHLMERTQMLNNRLKQFSFAVAHDIRNPLAHIQVLCSALEEGLMEAPEVMAQVNQLASRVCQFMDSILLHSSYAKSEDVENISLSDLIGEVIQFLGVLIESKQAEISAEDLPLIRGSHGLLFQLFLNIIGNALKYSSPQHRPKVEILYKSTEKWLKIGVKDNGVGMTQEDLDIVKTPLTRGSSSRGTEGSGLGLSLAKNIMDEFGGRLDMESTLGQGTCVWLSFPLETMVAS